MDTIIYLLILIAAFVGIVVWAFGRKRKARALSRTPGSLSMMGSGEGLRVAAAG
jgi:hypothetical protein